MDRCISKQAKFFRAAELWKQTMIFEVGLNLTTFSDFCSLNH